MAPGDKSHALPSQNLHRSYLRTQHFDDVHSLHCNLSSYTTDRRRCLTPRPPCYTTVAANTAVPTTKPPYAEKSCINSRSAATLSCVRPPANWQRSSGGLAHWPGLRGETDDSTPWNEAVRVGERGETRASEGRVETARGKGRGRGADPVRNDGARQRVDISRSTVC